MWKLWLRAYFLFHENYVIIPSFTWSKYLQHPTLVCFSAVVASSHVLKSSFDLDPMSSMCPSLLNPAALCINREHFKTIWGHHIRVYIYHTSPGKNCRIYMSGQVVPILPRPKQIKFQNLLTLWEWYKGESQSPHHHLAPSPLDTTSCMYADGQCCCHWSCSQTWRLHTAKTRAWISQSWSRPLTPCCRSHMEE